MKKLFLASLLALLSLCANAFVVDGISYKVTGNNTVEVTKNIEYTGDIVIPNSVIYDNKEYNVTSIGERAFELCNGITSINIPESVTNIEDWAFFGCLSMTSINIPKNVTSIGNNALGCCVNLTSITVASDNCVYDSRDNCNGIIRTEDNCLIIGCDCTIIPNSVTRIGDWAYSYSLIKSINIPASVTNIGEKLFIGCDSLTSITVANDNSIYDSRDNCNAIIRTKDNCLIRGCKGTVIPDGVTIIAKDAFVDCDIKTINIPTSVTSIEFNAFSSCDSITSINIPESVTSIGDRAFIYCSGLKSINIPTSITSIGEDTFYGCQNLTSINIPESVTSIGDNAFYGCI